jgi:hypothetical protein
MDKVTGLSVEQTDSCTALHLDQYINDAMEQYETFEKKSLRPKFTPTQPGNNLNASDSKLFQILDCRRITALWWLPSNLQRHE